MRNQNSEIEQLANDLIIGQTLVLDLGVRSWSTVPPKMSASTLLYDESWRRAYVMKKHAATEAVRSKKGIVAITSMLTFSMLAFGAWKMMDFGTTTPVPVMSASVTQMPAANRVEAPAQSKVSAQPAVTNLDLPVISNAKKLDASPAPQQMQGSPKGVLGKVATPSPAFKVASVEASPSSMVKVVDSKPTATAARVYPTAKSPQVGSQANEPAVVKVIDVKGSPVNEISLLGKPAGGSSQKVPMNRHAEVRTSTATIDPAARPSLATPILASKTQVAVPRASASSQTAPTPSLATQVEQTSGDAEKPMLAVDDTKAIALAEQQKAQAAALARSVKTEPEAAPREQSKAVTYPNYKILALTSSGVVISDPSNRMPKEFKIGAQLPGGEVVKTINLGTGQVTTEKRTLRVTD